MARYDVGGKLVRRKNGYMPCIISARFDDLPADEQERLFKATRWADLITEAEWAVLLGRVDDRRVLYRLRTKAKHWLMALGRIAFLNPDLFDQIRTAAVELYREQIEVDHPLFGTQRIFEIDGESYVITPGGRTVFTTLPDGRTVRLTVEVGRVVSAELEPMSRNGRDTHDAEATA